LWNLRAREDCHFRLRAQRWPVADGGRVFQHARGPQ
jgi:hypothetical protein